MEDRRERINWLSIEKDVDFDQVGRPVVGRLVVERGIALRPRLEQVEEVEDDLGEGYLIVEARHAPGSDSSCCPSHPVWWSPTP